MNEVRHSILLRLEDMALLDEGKGQVWYDHQVSQIDAWLALASEQEWQASSEFQRGNLAVRFLKGHPSPFFLECQQKQFRLLQRQLKATLQERLREWHQQGFKQFVADFQTWSAFMSWINATRTCYTEDMIPATAEQIILQRIERLSSSYEMDEKLSSLQKSYEKSGSASFPAHVREEAYRELQALLSVTRITTNALPYTRASTDTESWRESLYPFELEGNFPGLYTWAEEFFQKQRNFLEELAISVKEKSCINKRKV